MINYLKTFVRSIFVVTIKLFTVNLILATLLGIFVGGCYLLYLAIDPYVKADPASCGCDILVSWPLNGSTSLNGVGVLALGL